MRIMHFCSEYPPYGYGAGRYFEEISRGLRQLGHFSMVVTSRVPGQPEQEHVENGLILRKFDLADIGARWLAEYVQGLANEHEIDLIESADRLGEAAVLQRMGDRPPIMVNCRYNDIVYRARFAQAWYSWQKITIQLACLRQWRRMARERYSIEHADLLAAPSTWMMDSLLQQGVALPHRRAVLVKPLAAISDWENAESSRPTILLVGRIDVGKGIAYLPAILEIISTHFPDVKLEVAGPDSYSRGLGSVREWGEKRLGALRRHVRFLGALDAEALDAAYRRAWVVIVPSRWDTSPTVLLEAMVRATPVVASPFGGMAEYLGDDQWIHDPATPSFANAVIRLLQDAHLRSAYGSQLKDRVEKYFTQEQAALAYIQFVESSV